ncbi:MAG: fumarylacetoacetate hydrolase family protein [Bacteroidetes bacterium]|nr:fumarylacetoacetate hydrolase family protein [Bacteroidota bacterium]
MHTLHIAGSDERLPVGKMLCLGKNYEKHAKEMGGDVPADPVIFMKPATALVYDGGQVLIPAISNDLHHEVELVVVIGSTARDVAEAEAMNHVLGYAVGLDMTLRDLQSAAKKRGEPWAAAKGFDTSAPISTVVPAERVPDPAALELRLEVGGEVRQHGFTRDMILGIPATIAYLSRIFTLERGDCIFTGTPEGVGPVHPGDALHATIPGMAELRVSVARR